MVRDPPLAAAAQSGLAPAIPPFKYSAGQQSSPRPYPTDQTVVKGNAGKVRRPGSGAVLEPEDAIV